MTTGRSSLLAPEDLGGRIKQLRKRLSMTQIEFASATQTTQASISRAEKGAVTDAVLLHRMASLAGVSVDWLLTGYASKQEVRGLTAVAEEVAHYDLSREMIDLVDQLKRNPAVADTMAILLRSGKTGTELLQRLGNLDQEQLKLILQLVKELTK